METCCEWPMAVLNQPCKTKIGSTVFTALAIANTLCKRRDKIVWIVTHNLMQIFGCLLAWGLKMKTQISTAAAAKLGGNNFIT